MDLEVDLVVVDFGVNDAVLDQFHMDPNNAKLAHEVFIRYVRNEMIDMPALLYAESFISPARLRDAPLQASNMAEIHSAVTRKYDIPMVSGIVRGHMRCTNLLMRCRCNTSCITLRRVIPSS